MGCINGLPRNIFEGPLRICSGVAAHPPRFISVTFSFMDTLTGFPQPCNGHIELESKFLDSSPCCFPLKSCYLSGFCFHHLQNEAVELGGFSDPFEI